MLQDLIYENEKVIGTEKIKINIFYHIVRRLSEKYSTPTFILSFKGKLIGSVAEEVDKRL